MSAQRTGVRLALLTALLSTALGAYAQSADRPLRLVLGAGLSNGGDRLATVRFGDGSSETIRAGGLVHLYVGGEYRFDQRFSGQVNVGYHVADTSEASNGSISFSRMPIEVLGHVALTPHWRLGGGVRFVQNAELRGTGVLAGTDRFEDTTGGVVEAEYLWSKSGGIKLRATSERYKVKGYDDSVSGNNLGIYVTGYF